MFSQLLMRIRKDANLIDLLRNSGIIYAGGIISLLLTFIQQVTTANLLGSTDYGFLAIILSSSLFVMLMFDFRTWEIGTKLLSQPVHEKNNAEIVQIVSWLFLLDLITGVLGSVILLVVSAWVSNLLFETTEFHILIQVYALGIPFRMLASGVLSCLPRVYDRFAWVTYKSIAFAALRLILMSGAALLGFGLSGVVVAAMLADIGNFIFQASVSAFIFRDHIKPAKLLDLTRPVAFAEGRKLLGDMWGISVLAGFHFHTFIPVMALLTTPEQVGIYRVGLDIAELIEKTIQPLYIVFSQRIISLYQTGTRKVFIHYLKQVASLLLVITTPLTLSIIVFAPLLLPRIFDSVVYDGLVIVTIVLALGYGIYTALQWWVRPTIVALDLGRAQNIVMALLIVVTTLGLTLVVPEMGALGGALMKFLFLVPYAILSILLSWWRLKHTTSISER